MSYLLKYLTWAIRLKQEGESHDVSKSAEKFKWFSVILEFIQNTIDSNIKFNRINKDKDQNYKELPAKIKISFTKTSFSNFSKNFMQFHQQSSIISIGHIDSKLCFNR